MLVMCVYPSVLESSSKNSIKNKTIGIYCRKSKKKINKIKINKEVEKNLEIKESTRSRSFLYIMNVMKKALVCLQVNGQCGCVI